MIIHNIKPYESMPWYMGICAFEAKTGTYQIAPLGLNWLIAIGLVLVHSLANPKFFITVFAYREELVRTHALNQQNYKQKVEIGDLKVQTRVLGDRVKQLEKIIADTVHEKHPTSNVHLSWTQPFGDK